MTGIGPQVRLTLLRRFRGRAIWVSLLFIAAPTVIALLSVSPHRPGSAVFAEAVQIAIALLAIIPPLHLAGAIGDEVDSHTFTYLWSRPIPRWSVLVAKLVALVPLVALSLIVAILPAWPISGVDGATFVRAAGALTVGAIATSGVAVGVGCLVPRYPLPAAIAFLLLLDITLGGIPFAGRNLSVSYHVRGLSGVFLGEDASSPASAALWCAAIAGIWLGLALWRVSRAEYARAD